MSSRLGSQQVMATDGMASFPGSSSNIRAQKSTDSQEIHHGTSMGIRQSQLYIYINNK